MDIIEDKAEYISTLTQGQTLLGDFNVLNYLARYPGVKNIVELGTSRGIGALILGSGGAKVTTIDNFMCIPYGEGGDKYLAAGERYRWTEALSHFLENYYYDGRISTLCSDTADAASKFEDGSVDLLFIDADHSYEGVSRDYNAWIDKVKINGIIAFHDYSDLHYGIRDFCNELMSTDSRIMVTDSKTKAHSVIKVFVKMRNDNTCEECQK